jgi:hypothetical protein
MLSNFQAAMAGLQLNRHTECEAGPLFIGSCVDPSLMRFGDMRSNIKSQAQSVAAGACSLAGERFKQFFAGQVRGIGSPRVSN